MYYCKSGKHNWINENDAKLCCNGWHRELRLFVIADRMCYSHVWVKDATVAEQVDASDLKSDSHK